LASTGPGITLTRGSFIVQQVEQQGSVAEVLSPKQMLPQAQELAESLAAGGVDRTGGRPGRTYSRLEGVTAPVAQG
jgi:hypothetical protein